MPATHDRERTIGVSDYGNEDGLADDLHVLPDFHGNPTPCADASAADLRLQQEFAKGAGSCAMGIGHENQMRSGCVMDGKTTI